MKAEYVSHFLKTCCYAIFLRSACKKHGGCLCRVSTPLLTRSAVTSSPASQAPPALQWSPKMQHCSGQMAVTSCRWPIHLCPVDRTTARIGCSAVDLDQQLMVSTRIKLHAKKTCYTARPICVELSVTDLQQATQQLGPAWTLMRAGTPGCPEIPDWLADNVPDGEAVGIDPYLHTVRTPLVML